MMAIVVGYEADVEGILEFSRLNPVKRAPLTPTQKARNLGEWYGFHNGVPSRFLVGRMHPEYSEEEIDSYIAGARQGKWQA